MSILVKKLTENEDFDYESLDAWLARNYDLDNDDIKDGFSTYTPSYTNLNFEWVKKPDIMKSCRPGYPNINISEDKAEEWLKQIIELAEIKPASILTFLTDWELESFYKFDLLKWYNDNGIKTYRIPIVDPVGASPTGFTKKGTPIYDPFAFSFFESQKLLSIIKSAPKPILFHCSAGIDRSGEAIKIIKGKK